MPKKQARNAFWYFMSEWKTTQEAKGRTFPNGFRDVQADPECNEAWRALNPTEKLRYTNKAKKAKAEPEHGKKTSTGEFIHLIKQEEQQAQDFAYTMEGHIRFLISNAKRYGSLPSLTFPFIHMNIYYMRKPDGGPVDYCPAEFAIGEFSIENGVSRYYHEIIRTDLHLGYAREAIETSEKTHRLHWDLPIGERDWALMYRNLMTFLEPLKVNGQLPPIYTTKDYTHILPSLFRRMIAAVRGETPNKFAVYSLESLYGHMLRAVNDHPESNAVNLLAKTQLEKGLFAYTPNIECEYHQTQDGTGQYCSLSVIRQWAFEFCDQCCRPLGVQMIPGIHCPDITDTKINNTFSGSMTSLISDCALSVLSATGVSEKYRLSVSARSRDEDAHRRRQNTHVEIIDHSLLNKEKNPPASSPAPLAADVLPRPLRTPATSSQALMGVVRMPPALNAENFPAIGGRGSPMRRDNRPENRRMEGPIWSHRGRKNSDSD